jgi:hypothetical protein
VNHAHAIREAVDARDLAREIGDRARFDGIDTGGAGAAGEEAEDAGSGCEIDDDVARPDHLVQGTVETRDTGSVREIAAMLVEDQ